MRKLLLVVVLFLSFAFIFLNIAEIEAVVFTIQRGDWRFVLLAVAVQACWILNIAASYRSVLRAIGLDEKIERLILLVTAANFLNVVAPSGGVGGVAVFISEAKRKGYSPAKATFAGVLVVFFDYVGFLIVLFLGLIVLFRRGNLSSVEIIASVILLCIAVFLAILIYMGMYSEQSMGRLLAWLARLVNTIMRPFIRRVYLSEDRAYSFAHEAAEGLQLIRQQPRNMLIPIALGLSSKSLLVSVLFLVFLAFKVPFSVGTLIAGFSIGYLFLIVSPTPAGVGFVESALTLGLRTLNVPLSEATVITLAYRGITFWLPLIVGMLAFRWLQRDH